MERSYDIGDRKRDFIRSKMIGCTIEAHTDLFASWLSAESVHNFLSHASLLCDDIRPQLFYIAAAEIVWCAAL